MFLAGLKFAMGLMTGTIVVLGMIVGLMVVTEWVIGWWKKQKRNKHGIKNPIRIFPAPQNRVLLQVWYPSWVDEPTESEHRKSEYLQ
jgi:hypothetical protein